MVAFTDPTSSTPVFVLSGERTGSTLLRYILNTHPEIHCPDELNLGQLCSALSTTIEGAYGRQGPLDEQSFREISQETIAETRAVAQEILDNSTRARGKRLWCEKSPANLNDLPTLRRVFPDAKYICLYRHCLDFVRSCLQACRYSFWPGLAPYVVRSPQNLIDAMAHAWLEKTRTQVQFERESSGRCLRIHYEVLVADPEGSLAALCTFLGVEPDSTLLGRVFSTEHAHRVGHGDENAKYSTQIYTSRLGLGNELPWRERLSSERLAEINALLEELGYPPLRPAESRYSLGVEEALAAATAGVESARGFFERELAVRVAAKPELARELSLAFRFVIPGEDGGDWVLDLSQPTAPAVRVGGEADVVVTMGSRVFLDLINGKLSAPSAFREGSLKVEGVRDPSVLLKLVHLLSAAPSAAPAARGDG